MITLVAGFEIKRLNWFKIVGMFEWEEGVKNDIRK